MRNVMKTCLLAIFICFSFTTHAAPDYKRNEAVPVNQVLFGHVLSVRNITETELIQDRNRGWKTFGGALLGGAIGNQFGSGSGRAITTVLGALIGGNLANEGQPRTRTIQLHLVELMIRIEDGHDYMVIQDFDPQMIFKQNDKIRMIYLADDSVRIDKQI